MCLASYLGDGQERNNKKTANNSSYTSTYSYNIRSWLEKIEGAKFTQQLYYNTGVGTSCYNGNISSMTWKAGGESALRSYKFSYDGLNRLTSSVYGEGTAIASNLNRYTENMTYDKMRNILSVKRYGKLSATSFGVIDDLSLSYTGNQLQKVTDRVTQAIPEEVMHFIDNANSNTEYTYDSNGNLTSDLNKNISKIEYNVLNLPEKVIFSNGDSIRYIYSAGSSKLRVTRYIGQSTSVTDYVGSMIYENGILSKILTENGYVSFSGTTPMYHYYLTDHSGNNRVVMDASGSIEQVNHYYPFGGMIAESSGQETQAWKFGGKELDRAGGLDQYDFGVRQYDPLLGKWTAYDPLAEKNYSWSPYAYCFNNPLKYIDPDGRDGMRTGSGTKDDPYVITANYYYNTGSLDDELVAGLNAAISQYNNEGKARKVEIGGKVTYVKFKLSAQEVDDSNEAQNKDEFSAEDVGGGKTRKVSYGNRVKISNSKNEEYGAGADKDIYINTDNISETVSSSRVINRKKLIAGTFVHEIGHNLGLADEDGKFTSIMINVQTTIYKDQSGRTTNESVIYPKVDKKGISLMLERVNKPRVENLGIIKTK